VFIIVCFLSLLFYPEITEKLQGFLFSAFVLKTDEE